MTKLSFEDLQIDAQLRPAVSGEMAKATNEEIAEILLAESVQFISGRKPTPEASASVVAVYQLALASTQKDAFSVIRERIIHLNDKIAKARQSDNDENTPAHQRAVGYVLNFIRRLQSQNARGCYFLKRLAERREDAKDPREVRTQYDGFRYVGFDAEQVTEVDDMLYDQLTHAYGLLLQLADNWTVQNMGYLPYATVQIDGEYRDIHDAKALADALEMSMPVMPTEAETLAALGLNNSTAPAAKTKK